MCAMVILVHQKHKLWFDNYWPGGTSWNARNGTCRSYINRQRVKHLVSTVFADLTIHRTKFEQNFLPSWVQAPFSTTRSRILEQPRCPVRHSYGAAQYTVLTLARIKVAAWRWCWRWDRNQFYSSVLLNVSIVNQQGFPQSGVAGRSAPL